MVVDTVRTSFIGPAGPLSFSFYDGARHRADLVAEASASGDVWMAGLIDAFEDGASCGFEEFKSRLPWKGGLGWGEPEVTGCFVTRRAVEGGVRYAARMFASFNTSPSEAEVAAAGRALQKFLILLIR